MEEMAGVENMFLKMTESVTEDMADLCIKSDTGRDSPLF
jgi:hypothetical protein